jgi:hypothetical protein
MIGHFDGKTIHTPVILIHALYTPTVALAVLKQLRAADVLVVCSRHPEMFTKSATACAAQVAEADKKPEAVLEELIRRQRKGKEAQDHVVIVFHECVFSTEKDTAFTFRYHLRAAKACNITVLMCVTAFGGIPDFPKTFATHVLVDPQCYKSADDIRFLQRNLFTFASPSQCGALRAILDSTAFGEYLVGTVPQQTTTTTPATILSQVYSSFR